MLYPYQSWGGTLGVVGVEILRGAIGIYGAIVAWSGIATAELLFSGFGDFPSLRGGNGSRESPPGRRSSGITK